MPKMQVTFHNALQNSGWLQQDNQLTTLVFQIDYCGKSYDCIGHIESGARNENGQPARFSGYCGYNGRIDIEKLSSAAEDYYGSIIERMKPPISRLIDKEIKHSSQESNELTAGSKKSYEFNIGQVPS